MPILGWTFNNLDRSQAHIRTPEGVTVLYGLNGSGKSRVLNAMKRSAIPPASLDAYADDGGYSMRVLEANRVWSYAKDGRSLARVKGWYPAYALDLIHMRVLKPADSPPDDVASSQAFRAELGRLNERYVEERGGNYKLAPGESGFDFSTAPLPLLDQAASVGELNPVWRELADELIGQGYWSLSPKEGGAFLTYLSFLPSDAPPRTRQLWDSAQALWRDLIGRHEWGTERTPLSVVTRVLNEVRRGGEPAGAWLDEFHLLDVPPAPELLGLPPWPAWAPMPLLLVGDEFGLAGHFGLDVVVEADLTVGDLNSRTSQLLMEINRGFNFAEDEGGDLLWDLDVHDRQLGLTSLLGPEGATFSEGVIGLVASLGYAATQFARGLLAGAPNIVFQLNPWPEGWSIEGIGRWEAFDEPSQTWVPMEALSRAQLRWASLAIQSALSAERLRFIHIPKHRERLILLDEPEFALHALAQREVADGLARLSGRVVCATHSPVLLSRYENVVHVQRSENGSVELSPLSRLMRAKLDENWARTLGIGVTDLLQVVRVLVLVEGDHDAVVLRGLLGNELERARAHVIRMEGTLRLEHIAEAHLLYELTEASVLVVLDGLRTQHMDTWRTVQDLARRGQHDQATKVVLAAKREVSGDPTGAITLALLEDAVKSRSIGRLNVFGLARKDIVNYLPIEDFLPDFPTWDRAFAQYARECRDTHVPVSGANYKKWCRAHGANLSIPGVAKAVRLLGSGERQLDVKAAEEFNMLRETIVGLAGVQML